jgi:hypothetical protein
MIVLLVSLMTTILASVPREKQLLFQKRILATLLTLGSRTDAFWLHRAQFDAARRVIVDSEHVIANFEDSSAAN